MMTNLYHASVGHKQQAWVQTDSKQIKGTKEIEVIKGRSKKTAVAIKETEIE